MSALALVSNEAPDHDPDLVRRALDGHPRSQLRLLQKLRPVIFNRVRRRLGGSGYGIDIEDVAQDVWHALFKNEGAQLAAWNPSRGYSLETTSG